jgi:hypothetical protein
MESWSREYPPGEDLAKIKKLANDLESRVSNREDNRRCHRTTFPGHPRENDYGPYDKSGFLEAGLERAF